MNSKKLIHVNMKELSTLIISALNANSDVNLTVTGNSMYPLFRSGIDSVVLSVVKNVKKYDIPLYKRENGEYVLHRIIKIDSNCLYLAGDNQTNIEFPIYQSQVIAVVKAFYRNGKYVSCKNIFYKLYSIFWVLFLTQRHNILRVLKKVQSILQNLRRKCCGK